MQMQYLGRSGHGPNKKRLTQLKNYEVLNWFNPGGDTMNGLVEDDSGRLFVAQSFNDSEEWGVAVVAAAPIATASESKTSKKTSN